MKFKYLLILILFGVIHFFLRDILNYLLPIQDREIMIYSRFALRLVISLLLICPFIIKEGREFIYTIKNHQTNTYKELVFDSIIFSVMGFVVFYYICALINYEWVQPQLSSLIINFRYHDNTVLNYSMYSLFYIVSAPIIEEIVFRYALMGILLSFMSERKVLVVQAVIFMFMHSRIDPSTLLTGFYLGILYLRYRNILLCILAHALFNLSFVLYATLIHILDLPVYGWFIALAPLLLTFTQAKGVINRFIIIWKEKYQAVINNE